MAIEKLNAELMTRLALRSPSLSALRTRLLEDHPKASRFELPTPFTSYPASAGVIEQDLSAETLRVVACIERALKGSAKG